jgi:hypothetical protein
VDEKVPATTVSAAQTTCSGVKGIHSEGLSETSNTTTTGLTSVYTTTAVGGGRGATIMLTTIVPTITENAAAARSGNTLEGMRGGQVEVLSAVCIATEFFVLVWVEVGVLEYNLIMKGG